MNKLDYKKLTSDDLNYLFSDAGFRTKPMWHQLVSLAFSLDDRQRVNYFHDIGTGKTLAALYTKQLWETGKTLVVCPRSAFAAWRRDISLHTNYTYTILDGNGQERRAKLGKNSDIFIINYEGLKTLYGTRVANKGWIVDVRSFNDDFDCVVFDEIHKCINPKSLQSRICYRLSWKANYAIGLTGTPVSSSLIDLWAEMRIVDLGNSLGTNFYSFRRNYFKQWGYNWAPKKKTKEKILDLVSNASISFERRECFDLPLATYTQRTVAMTSGQRGAERKILNGLRLEYETGGITNDNVLTNVIKLRQVTGGFLYLTNAEDERVVKRFEQSQKLVALHDCILEADGKIVLFHQFREEGRIIEEFCIKQKVPFASYRGEIKDKDAQAEKFSSDPSIKLMIAHPTSAKESLDFSFCSTMIFYSNGWSFLERKQAEGRILRKGQTEKCLFIDLLCEDSIDQIVSRRINDKSKLSREVLDYIRGQHG